MDIKDDAQGKLGQAPAGAADESGSTLQHVSMSEALHRAQSHLAGKETLRFLLISSKYLKAGLEPRSFVPMLRKGTIDVIVASPALLDIDLGLSGPDRGRRPQRSSNPKGETRGFVRIHDVAMERRIIHYPRHFVSQIITASKFQKVAASATIARLLGGYIKEREKILDEPPGLLSTAYDVGAPLYIPDVLNSEFGSVIAGEALNGNRLGHDPTLDINEVAGLLLESGQFDDGCLVLSLGGGKPLRFVLRSSRFLQETLGIREPPCHSAFVLTESRDRFLYPDSEARRGAEKRLKRSLTGFVAESTATEAARALTQATEELPDRPPRILEDQRENIWERLRKAHVEATALKNWPPIKMKFPGKG